MTLRENQHGDAHRRDAPEPVFCSRADSLLFSSQPMGTAGKPWALMWGGRGVCKETPAYGTPEDSPSVGAAGKAALE